VYRYVADEALSTSFWTLTDEGGDIIKNGSPEFQVLLAVPTDEVGISTSELQSKLPADVVKIGLGPCMKNKWLTKKGDNIIRVISTTPVDETSNTLMSIAASGTH
jgi:phenylalanyl-tRNA synthetase alpha chain